MLIGSQVTCDPNGGGIVVGNVKDANTNGFVNGAVVTRDGSSESATTVATPEDTGLNDGFYWMYSSAAGDQGFTAKAGNYVSATATVNVEADWTTQADYALKAGRLSVTPGSVSGNLKLPTGKVTKSFTVTNTGGADVDVKFGEKDNGFVLENANGTKTTKAQVLTSTGAPLQRLAVPTSFASMLSGKTAGTPAVAQPLAAPWTDIADYPATVMDNRVVNLDGKVYSIAGGNGNASTANSYVYDPASMAWTAIAPLPGARNAVTVGAVGGKIIASSGWAAAGPDAATWAYDPAANAWTSVAANPAPRAAAGQAVADGKLYAVGGCTTSGCLPMSNTVVRYDPGTNAWETLANYPKSVAFASCGAIDGKVYCAGGNDGTNSLKSAYVYDPGADSWTAVADAPSDHWAASYAVAGGKLLIVGGVQAGAVTNAGFSYDPASDSWTALPNSNLPRYRGGAACGFYKVGGSSGGFTGHGRQRGPAGSRGLLRVVGGRELAVHRQDRGHPGPGRVDDGQGHAHRERGPARHLQRCRDDRREHPLLGRTGRRDDERHPADLLEQAAGHRLGRQLGRRHRSAPGRDRRGGLVGAVLHVHHRQGRQATPTGWTVATTPSP